MGGDKIGVVGTEAERCEEQFGDCEIADAHRAHIDKGYVEAGPGAVFGGLRIVAAQTLANHSRYGDAATDKRHKGQAVDIEGEVSRGQRNRTQAPNDKYK